MFDFWASEVDWFFVFSQAQALLDKVKQDAIVGAMYGDAVLQPTGVASSSVAAPAKRQLKERISDCSSQDLLW